MTEVGSAASAVRPQVEALFRAFNEHDSDQIIALHAPDAVWDDPLLTEPVKGRAAIAVRLAMMLRAFPDLHFVMDELEVYRADSGRVAASWHFTATMTGRMDPPGFARTGRKASVSGVCLYEFEDGLLTRHTIVYDTMGMLRQVGIMPAPTGAPAKLMAGMQRTSAGISRRVRRR